MNKKELNTMYKTYKTISKTDIELFEICKNLASTEVKNRTISNFETFLHYIGIKSQYTQILNNTSKIIMQLGAAFAIGKRLPTSFKKFNELNKIQQEAYIVEYDNAKRIIDTLPH